MLNASRHHRKNRCRKRYNLDSILRCSTPRGITGKIAPLHKRPFRKNVVLNASRHHRKNRLMLHKNLFRHPKCSTPRGITGKIAARPYVQQTALSLVLNASRHHRKNRQKFVTGLVIISPCSTPRGITGKIAVTRKNSPAPNSGAQRLAASPEKSPAYATKANVVNSVLNASRHHRKNRVSPGATPLPPKCAQRLAASPEKSRFKSRN